MLETNYCGICYETRPIAKLSCGHGFCAQCLRKQLRFNARCAFCRTTFEVISQPLAEYSLTAHRLVRIGARPCGTQWGITVVDADKDGDGVHVTAVHHGPLRKAGVRRGARILTINGIPCYTHTVTIQILQALTKNGRAVNFVIDEQAQQKSLHWTRRLKLWQMCLRHRIASVYRDATA